MASLQKKGESWYCQFRYERQRHTLNLGKVDEEEAKATAARIDYLLMRIRQRLLTVPSSMDITKFIEHDGKPPPVSELAPRSETKPNPVVTPFADFRDAYLRTLS